VPAVALEFAEQVMVCACPFFMSVVTIVSAEPPLAEKNDT
jgi:hypothetical protein